MDTTTDRIFYLIEKYQTNANALSKALNFKNNSNFTQWKKGISKPNTEAITKIAQYFNVSTDYLLGLTDQEQGTPYTENIPLLSEEEKELITKFRQLSEEDKKAAIKNIDGLILLQNKANEPPNFIPPEMPKHNVYVFSRSEKNDVPPKILQMTDEEEYELVEFLRAQKTKD